MTEPPEPRRPEEDGGETPQEEAARLAREQLERVHELTGNTDPVTEDEVHAYLEAASTMRYGDDIAEQLEDDEIDQLDTDILLDLLGSGNDVADDEASELLGAWRDDIDSEPVGPGTAPETVQQIHDFTQEIDRATAPPPRSTEGSSPAMSLVDVIARLQLVANNGASSSALAQAQAHINNTVVPLLMQAVNELVENKNAAAEVLDGNPNAAAEVGGAAEHAAGAIEDAMELTQAAQLGIGQALEHEGAFRQVALDAANRLAGS